VCHLIKKFPSFVETQVLLPDAEASDTGPSPELDKYILHRYILFPLYRSPKCSFPFRRLEPSGILRRVV
jgi:hypothetical protein